VIGSFQVLALIPGTSRSGATVLGGLAAGLSKRTAAEFSFILAIPTMLGASALRLVKFFLEGNVLTVTEFFMLISGSVAAFLVSLLSIRALLSFVRRHSFAGFGVYRILLGALVLFSLFF
jgi:undecaprenyl-diphosphatase